MGSLKIAGRATSPSSRDMTMYFAGAHTCIPSTLARNERIQTSTHKRYQVLLNTAVDRVDDHIFADPSNYI